MVSYRFFLYRWTFCGSQVFMCGAHILPRYERVWISEFICEGYALFNVIIDALVPDTNLNMYHYLFIIQVLRLVQLHNFLVLHFPMDVTPILVHINNIFLHIFSLVLNWPAWLVYKNKRYNPWSCLIFQ